MSRWATPLSWMCCAVGGAWGGGVGDGARVGRAACGDADLVVADGRRARLERTQHLREQPRDLGLAQRVRPLQVGGEVAARAVLRHDVDGVTAKRVGLEEDGVHLDELRVLQPRQLHRLVGGLARRAQVGHDDLLDCDLVAGGRVPGQHRGPEAALAEHAQQLVIAHALAATAAHAARGLREHRAVRASRRERICSLLETCDKPACMHALQPELHQVLYSALEQSAAIDLFCADLRDVLNEFKLGEEGGHVVHAPVPGV